MVDGAGVSTALVLYQSGVGTYLDVSGMKVLSTESNNQNKGLTKCSETAMGQWITVLKRYFRYLDQVLDGSHRSWGILSEPVLSLPSFTQRLPGYCFVIAASETLGRKTGRICRAINDYKRF